jgi:hypothetical protein
MSAELQSSPSDVNILKRPADHLESEEDDTLRVCEKHHRANTTAESDSPDSLPESTEINANGGN